jgi:hypothetical protein
VKRIKMVGTFKIGAQKDLDFAFPEFTACFSRSATDEGRTRRHERGAERGGRRGADRRAALTRTAKSCGPSIKSKKLLFFK